MNVLVACEFSGVVRDAFRARGHNAWSCDILPPALGDGTRHDGIGHVFHLQGDVRRVLRGNIPADMVSDSSFRRTPVLIAWDLMIAHPPCTYLCSSGLHWVKRGRIEADGRHRAEHVEEALDFVRTLMDAPIPRIDIENPVGCIGTRIRKADQIIHPYQFGHDASKATAFWLKNLPKLKPTAFVEPRLVCDDFRTVFTYGQHRCPACGGESYKPRWGNQTDSGQNKLPPTADRWALRSETYAGIAAAMANQWGRW